MDNVKWHNAAFDSRMLHLWLFLGLQGYISISKIAVCELHGSKSPYTYLYILIIHAANFPLYSGQMRAILKSIFMFPNQTFLRKKLAVLIASNNEDVCFCPLSTTLKFPDVLSLSFSCLHFDHRVKVCSRWMCSVPTDRIFRILYCLRTRREGFKDAIFPKFIYYTDKMLV